MRLVVGITGASGVLYGIRLLEVARQVGLETHLVMSPHAAKNIEFETGRSVSEVQGLAHQVYDFKDLGAPISSGSFITSGMVVVPCSIKTLSGIATSYNNTLIIRAADVCLKERRKLVLVVRETPLHLGHLRLMAGVTEMGGVIMPPVPAFYHSPKTIDDLVNQTVGKVLDQFGIDAGLYDRWSGDGR